MVSQRTLTGCKGPAHTAAINKLASMASFILSNEIINEGMILDFFVFICLRAKCLSKR
jgi:hypothetical protein